MKRFKSGFTLAEVLITLGIIGVVAAITMPTLITSYQYKAVGVKIGKFVSQLENAARAYVEQNESFSNDNESAVVVDFFNTSYVIKNKAALGAKDAVDEVKSANGEIISSKRGKMAELMSDQAPFTRGSSDDGFTGSNGRFITNDPDRAAILKDGTQIVLYPLNTYTVDTDNEFDVRQVGDPVFGITFSPQIAGLPSAAQQSYDFIVTELGFVFPNNSDHCAGFITTNEFSTNNKTFGEGLACSKSAGNS